MKTPIDLLKSHEIKPNTNRMLVIQHFMDDHKAHSLCTLHELLKDQMDRTTVYRILILFTDKGILQKIPCSDGNILFALNSGNSEKKNNTHFRCKYCQKVENLPDLPEEYLQRLTDQKINLEGIAFEGYCMDCSQ